MITINDVKQISKKISLENGISENDLSEDVSEIVYRTDVFECDDASVIDRHNNPCRNNSRHRQHQH